MLKERRAGLDVEAEVEGIADGKAEPAEIAGIDPGKSEVNIVALGNQGCRGFDCLGSGFGLLGERTICVDADGKGLEAALDAHDSRDCFRGDLRRAVLSEIEEGNRHRLEPHALAAGAIIYYTGWLQADPLLSLVVSLLLLRSTVNVLRESYHFLMEGVPHDVDYVRVGEELEGIAGVISVHDLHVWEMTPGESALIGHVEVRDLQEWPTVLREIKAMLLERHGIDHVTLQAELPDMVGGVH